MKIIRKVVNVFGCVVDIFASFQSCQSMMGGRYAAGETISYNGQTCKDEYMLGMKFIKYHGANIHQTVTIRMWMWKCGWLQKRE